MTSLRSLAEVSVFGNRTEIFELFE